MENLARTDTNAAAVEDPTLEKGDTAWRNCSQERTHAGAGLC